MSRIWPISFNKRFVDLVESGAKHQTIRANRKDGRRPEPGDFIHCYFGLRTKHTRKLRGAIIRAVHDVRIDVSLRDVWVNGKRVLARDCTAFARADGFDSYHEMMTWWQSTHRGSAVFHGFMVVW